MNTNLKKSIIRRIIISCALVGVITGLGFFLHKPPAFLDALSGSSSVSKSDTGQNEEGLEGNYIFVMNMGRNIFSDYSIREDIKGLVQKNGIINSGQTQEGLQNKEENQKNNISFRLSVTLEDAALMNYANELSMRLKESGIEAFVTPYSKTMLRSRILAGKFDCFLTTRGFIDAKSVTDSDFIMLSAQDMR